MWRRVSSYLRVLALVLFWFIFVALLNLAVHEDVRDPACHVTDPACYVTDPACVTCACCIVPNCFDLLFHPWFWGIAVAVIWIDAMMCVLVCTLPLTARYRTAERECVCTVHVSSTVSDVLRVSMCMFHCDVLNNRLFCSWNVLQWECVHTEKR